VSKLKGFKGIHSLKRVYWARDEGGTAKQHSLVGERQKFREELIEKEKRKQQVRTTSATAKSQSAGSGSRTGTRGTEVKCKLLF